MTALLVSAAADRAGDDVVLAARACAEHGWMPANAGNVSVRVDADTLLITPSGANKGTLAARDLVRVRISTGAVLDAGRPSAETAIHAAIYLTTDAQAVVHAHPLHATALASSRRGRRLRLLGWELLKVFAPGDGPLDVPVFGNPPHVATIGDEVARHLSAQGPHPPVLLLAGHGATVWAGGVQAALVRMEAIEATCALVLTTGRTTARRPRTPTRRRHPDLRSTR